MSKTDWRGLTLCLLAVALVLGGLPFLKGGFYIGKHEGDTLQMADIVFRMAAGNWPHLDFMTPIGVLAAAPIALFVRLGMQFGHAIFAAQLLVALVLLPAAVAVISRRARDDWSGWIYGAFIMVLCVALVHGEAQNSISISMHYNRWAWAITYVLVPIVMLAPRGGERPASEGVILGLGLAALVLIKATYFVSLAPGLAIGLIARRWWRTMAVAVLAGLAVAGLVTALAGVQFWTAYAGDLLTVARSSARPQPGETFGMVAAAPAYMGGTIALLAIVIFLRQAGRLTEGMVLLFLAPGFIYIVFQNYGNDPQWLPAVAFFAWTLRPDAPVLTAKGFDLRAGIMVAGLLAAAFGFPSAVNLAYSPIRHLFAATEKMGSLIGIPGQSDIKVLQSRLYDVREMRAGDDPGTPYATYRSREGRPDPSVLNGEELPYCEQQSGLRAWFETAAHDMEAAGYRGKKMLAVDLFSAFYLYGDLAPVPHAAPWNYGGLSGVDDADYLVVPLCPGSQQIRSSVLKALKAANYTLTVKERRPLYIVVEAKRAP
ncbi:MAG: hypothetical protein JSR87_10725 [Proteobacteria bacterium]|nr:hypothetical protein [Pseudomonadota bacterium]MBS0574410.1 hypothetical protein [Pseudomonadota bacterium]